VFDDQIADFRRICATLVTMGKFVDSDTCLSMLRGETPIDGSYYHLSFDDGFRNILNNAVPILNDFSIPATIFVPTAMVEADYETIRHYCVKTTRYAAPIEVLTWRDLAELQRTGFTIGSHTRTQPPKRDCLVESRT
jgi:peptidoglycan/xylan/chitin deacetylase (PgdA/CDA1 family)